MQATDQRASNGPQVYELNGPTEQEHNRHMSRRNNGGNNRDDSSLTGGTMTGTSDTNTGKSTGKAGNKPRQIGSGRNGRGEIHAGSTAGYIR
jgi:hypothetical protein